MAYCFLLVLVGVWPSIDPPFPQLTRLNLDPPFGAEAGGPSPNLMHTNAVEYNADLDQILLSVPNFSEIWIIDHSTTTEESASHNGGNYGKGGDFLYRWGNPQNYNRGQESDQILRDQHSINWISDNSPGMNNFILFNNYHSGSFPGGESAVLEFISSVDEVGNYTIENDESFGPENYIWSYSDNIFSLMQGGAFRLPNGNTLITDCDSAHILEVTELGEIVWEYTESGNNVAIARAQKYGIDYFDNNDIIIGDLNGDNILNILDIVILMDLIISNNFVELGDINSDGVLNILDIVSLINLILSDRNL